MNPHSEIDDVLQRLAGVEPPAGLERRVCQMLQARRSRAHIRTVQALASFALAACLALTAILLNPALRNRLWHHRGSDQSVGTTGTPRVAAPATPGGFGAASAVHVPAGPVAVVPTPVNQGRGRSRSSEGNRPRITKSVR